MILESYNYWITIALMMTGLYMVIAQGNLLKKVVGLSILQSSVFVLYISISTLEGGTAPILEPGIERYSNPLPQVLMLTAIVVGIAQIALALALLVRIQRAYGSIEDEDLQSPDDAE